MEDHAWLHDLDPVIFAITDGLKIRWYGLAYVLGILVAWELMKRLARRGAILLDEDRVGDAMMAMVLGVVLGGRLGYVFFYKPALLIDFEASFPFWDVLRVTEGGMASHGGIIGVCIAALWVARGRRQPDGTRTNRIPALHMMDIAALLCPFGFLFGRLANFINGELLGRIVAKPGEPGPWWSVRYPQEVLTGHAPELEDDRKDALFQLIAEHQFPGEDWVDAYGRVLQKLRDGVPEIEERLRPLISARYPSQLVQAFFEAIVVGAIVAIIAMKPRKAGVVGCWYIILFGLQRIGTEFVRLPDDHLLKRDILGLSRGQALSLGLSLAGVGILIWCLRRPGPRIGGWATRPEATDAEGDQEAHADKPES